MAQVLIIHGYRGPATGGEYWLPNTTHDVSDEQAAYLIDNGHARPAVPVTRSAPIAPVEVVEDTPAQEVEAQPERPRGRRGNRG